MLGSGERIRSHVITDFQVSVCYMLHVTCYIKALFLKTAHRTEGLMTKSMWEMTHKLGFFESFLLTSSLFRRSSNSLAFAFDCQID